VRRRAYQKLREAERRELLICFAKIVFERVYQYKHRAARGLLLAEGFHGVFELADLRKPVLMDTPAMRKAQAVRQDRSGRLPPRDEILEPAIAVPTSHVR